MPRDLRLSRRAVLRGAGACLGLPLLEAMLPRRASATGVTSPKRLIVFFVPNGMWMPDFTPTAAGTAFTLPWLLEPLAPWRDRTLVVSGLKSPAGEGEPHSAAAGALLTAAPTDSSQGQAIAVGTSMDQVAAQALGAATRFPSLQLGSEGSLACDVRGEGGYQAQCAYLWNVSWADAVTPMPKEVRPGAVFDRLFGDLGVVEDAATRDRRRRYERSVLDAVLQDKRDLDGWLGTADRQRLDAWLTGIEELERRLTFDAVPTEACGAAAQAWRDLHPEREPTDVVEHVAQMTGLMTLALQCDATRVITYMLGNARSDRPYPFLGVPDSHHYLSHHGGDPNRIAAIRTIYRWEVERLAALAGALDAVVEPDGGTLLDRTAIVLCSEISEPDSHRFRDLPLLVVGDAGGAIATGQHLVVPHEPSVGELHVALLQALGLEVTALGEAQRPLPGVRV